RKGREGGGCEGGVGALANAAESRAKTAAKSRGDKQVPRVVRRGPLGARARRRHDHSHVDGDRPPPLESPAPRRARAPPPPAGLTPPARSRRGTSVLSPPRSAPPYLGRGAGTGRRRAFWPCAHRSKIEASAIGDGGTHTRGRAEERLHEPVAGVEVDAVSEARLRHGAPFVCSRASVLGNPRLCNGLIAAILILAWPHVRLPMVTARRAGRAGAQI